MGIVHARAAYGNGNGANSGDAVSEHLKGDLHYIEPGTITAAMLDAGIGGGPHTHPESEVTNLTSDLSGKAATGHNHDASYATMGHTHSQAFPVGSVFVSIVSTNPNTLLGYGTWVAFGAGRFLVGLDAGQTEFDTVEETGGAKTHPHSFTQPGTHADHTLSGAIATENGHTHAYTQTVNHLHTLATGTTATGNFSQVIGTVDTSSGGTGGTPTQTALGTLSGNPSGGVASGTSAAGSAHGHGNGTLTASAHAAHAGGAVVDGSTLPPYITAYLWKRTA